MRTGYVLHFPDDEINHVVIFKVDRDDEEMMAKLERLMKYLTHDDEGKEDYSVETIFIDDTKTYEDIDDWMENVEEWEEELELNKVA